MPSDVGRPQSNANPEMDSTLATRSTAALAVAAEMHVLQRRKWANNMEGPIHLPAALESHDNLPKILN